MNSSTHITRDLKRLDTVKLDNQLLTSARALNGFYSAAFGRKIENPDAVIVLAQPP